MSRYEGRVIFIPEVIPGESVLAAITRIYPGYAEARLVRVLRPSPDRVPPPCPHFGTCGGCSLQYIEPKQQFEYKIDAFVDSLKRIAKIPVQSLPEVRRFSSSSRGYRNRMRFIAGEDGVWGLRAMQSNRVVELSTCVIAHERIREAVENPSLPAGVMPGNEFTVFADNSGMWFGNEQVSTTVLGHSFSFPADKFFQSNKDVLEEGLPYI
ncbi:MAG: class I SAM-dependent RNA methyltransferase, partial [Spirochaeta sp.]